MKKRSQETKPPRRHAFVEKAPVPAAIILAAAGWFMALTVAGMINIFINAAAESYPRQGLVGHLIGAALILFLYKWWFRPEFQGQIIGGRPGRGFLLGLIFIAYFAVSLLIPVDGLVTELEKPSFAEVSLAFAAGVGEELCFRGLFLGTLMRQWKDDHRKMMIAVLLSSVLFGATHLTNIQAGAGVLVSVMQAVSSAFIGVGFAAVYIRSGNLLVPMFYHVLVDIMAFATNASVQDTGVVGGTYQLPDMIDDALCLILMIAGLWMLRSGVFEEIREIWNEKWKVSNQQETLTD